jgi:N-acetyl-alpha-D-glucosaminyl L-malate synthase BshA
MRIGITCYPTYGGSGAVATELGIELGKRGHEVHVISYASPFRLRGYAPNVSFHEVDVSAKYPLFEFFPYDLALAVKQHEVALREKLDVLHVHYAVPHATAAFLAKQMLGEDHPLKVVTTLHGTDITLVGQEKSFFEITKFSIERSDAITAVSAYLREETYRAFGCTSCAIEVIPNFVSLAEYYPSDDVRCRTDLAPKDSKILMHISNFRELKRVPDIIRAFAKVRAKVKSVLILVGDGPDREASEREAERLGVAKDVKFLGKLDAIADLLRAADVFLLPSTTESFGLAALEALACGVPVVATKVGGLPEVVDEQCGALVPVGDVDAIAAKSLELLTDSARWKKARTAAVAKAKLFAAETIVPQYESLYQRVVAE